MTNFFNGLIDSLQSVVVNLVNMLPKSPFQWEDISPLISVLGYVNYFIPINSFVKILSAWCVAVGSWYLVMLVLRWAKVIE